MTALSLLPAKYGSPWIASYLAMTSVYCFVACNDTNQLRLASPWPLFCQGEERSDAAIHVSFTKLYRLDIP